MSRSDAGSGMSLASAARRTYRESGVTENALERADLGRIERKARGRI
jgi:hypothetical protein